MFFNCCKTASGADPSAFIQAGNSPTSSNTPFNVPELVAKIKSFSSPEDRTPISRVTRDAAFNPMSKATVIDICLPKVEESINSKYFDRPSPSQVKRSVKMYAESAMNSQQENHVLEPYIFEANDIYMA